MKRLFIALVASSFLVAPTAFAQPASASFEVTQAKERHVERNVYKHGNTRIIEKKVVVKKNRWARGHRLSPAERRRIQEVNDYRRYRLHQPPRGQQWVRVDNDFLLISVATGVIAGIVVTN
ncbi:Ni/Co efflux regulator RcnB [Pararhizobium capsulatum DSM 1112]|uniref:Ni/Co efflux regulator RcnB n=1 Tax=Pararhizobium capsulatum DSM 1112 TaxID=1121113 RepID=A0ABU0BQW6_9HYPH|nr:RcnB family protein [Pararhizobium capsulatum]MDQ0320643.1 Ni/Co efflux regulator RcnB [Pararhizobium capsulatum DSM 1112]